VRQRSRSPARQPAREPAEKLLRIATLPAVEALFRQAPQRIERLYFLPAARGALGEICVALARTHKPYRVVRPDEIEKIAGTAMHGGVVALAQPPEVHRFDAALMEGEAVVALDAIGNPHNLGAIVRTAAFFGVRHVLLAGDHGQAGPSDAACRVAKGAIEHVTLWRAERLPDALRKLRRSHLVVATALERGVPLASLAPGGRPICLVLGNEEEGSGRAVLDASEAVVTLPGSGAVQSLNVAAAAAILIHALLARYVPRA
jgi:TrmH RNA methyltransferase